MKSVAIIGGGAAGFFAAIRAAETGCKVTLIEKSNKLLSKVRISGGGRCNVTNGCDPSQLFEHYPRGGKELRGPFTKFNNADTIHWFESRGVPLKTEPDGRVFPVSNNSQSIINCLLAEAEKNRVKIMLNAPVVRLIKAADEFILTFPDGNQEHFNHVIVATGGNPSLNAYKWLEESGHSILSPVPSLFTFNIPSNPFEGLMGISVPNVSVKIEGSPFSQPGPLLFTHWGLSGPAILKLSALAARWLHDANYECRVLVNFSGNHNGERIREELINYKNHNHKQVICSNSMYQLPLRLWERICKLAGINDQRWNEISRKHVFSLVELIHAAPFQMKGKTTFKEEFVTCGGVSLTGVNMKTLESKIIPGLYFAGEVLDIDAITGGFNFQAAWTTGYLAGSNILK